MLLKYEPSEVKKTVTGCDLDSTIDNVQSLPKLGAADLSNITPVSAKVKRKDIDEDVQGTSVRRPKVLSAVLLVIIMVYDLL